MTLQYQTGDLSDLPVAASAGVLIDAGPDYLTRLFRHSGVLGDDNAVTELRSHAAFEGGSTGQKLRLSLRYRRPDCGLHENLFVKFSRDFGDPRRDQTRVQMHSEVRLALVSNSPRFPIRVPRCYFADYHAATGTGMLITEEIAFGQGGVEPLYPKSVDHLIPQVEAHYRAVLRQLGRLAGTHRAGHLPDTVERYFGFDPAALVVNTSAPPARAQVEDLVQAYNDFASRYPSLLPQPIRSGSMLNSLHTWAPAVIEAGERIFAELGADPDHIALCHWNAQLDNAWFWRDSGGELQCGLLDWGNVGQMNVAMALWGALCGANSAIWTSLIDELVDEFMAAYAATGARALNRTRLLRHFDLYIAYMGVRYMLGSPAFIQSRFPSGAQPDGVLDELVQGDERIRSQLAILTNFLIRWQASDIEQLLNAL